MTTTEQPSTQAPEAPDSWFQLRCSHDGCKYKRNFPNVREARAVYQAHWQEGHPGGKITVRQLYAEVSEAYNAGSVASNPPSQTPPSLKVSTEEVAASFAGGVDRVVELAPDLVDPSPYQPRSEASLAAGLDELVAGIRENGQQVPVAARRKGDRYELLYGERRLRAVRAIGGGLRVKAIVREVDELEAIRAAFEENGRRRDLTPLEVARAVDRLLSGDAKLTQVQAAGILGIAQPTVANMRRILATAPKEAIEQVEKGAILWSALRALLPLAGKNCRHDDIAIAAVNRAVEYQWRDEAVAEGHLSRIVLDQAKKHWRPLDSKARNVVYPQPEAIDRTAYEKAAPGRIHDLGDREGEWACETKVFDAIAKEAAARRTANATAVAEKTTSPKAAKIVEKHVEEEVLPELRTKLAPGQTEEDLAGSIGKPLDLTGAAGHYQGLRGTGERLSGWELTKGQIAVNLQDAKPKLDNSSECNVCPHGGRRFALVKDYTSDDDRKVVEVCTNNKCMTGKIRAKNKQLDAQGDARRQREQVLADQVLGKIRESAPLGREEATFLLVTIAQGGQRPHHVKGAGYLQRRDIFDWFEDRLKTKLELTTNYRTRLDVRKLRKILAEMPNGEVNRLVFEAALAMVRDPRTGREFEASATKLLKPLTGAIPSETEEEQDDAAA